MLPGSGRCRSDTGRSQEATITMPAHAEAAVLAPVPGGPTAIDLKERVRSTASDQFMPYLLGAAAIFSGLVVTLLVFFVVQKAWPVFHAEGLRFITAGGWD